MPRFFRLTLDDRREVRAAAVAVAPTPLVGLTAARVLDDLLELEGPTVFRGGWSAPVKLRDLAERIGTCRETLRHHLDVLRKAGEVLVRRLGRLGVSISIPRLARAFAGRVMPPAVPAVPAPKAPSTPPSPPVRREPDPARTPCAPSPHPLDAAQEPALRLRSEAEGVRPGCGDGAAHPSEADLDRAVAQREREHDALRPDGRRERPPIRDRRAWRAAVRRGLRADPEALRETLARADAREAEADRARRAREAREAESARALEGASSARQVLERDRSERAAAWASYQALGAEERARVDAEAWARVPDPASPLAASRHRAAVEAIMRARRAT